MDDDHASDPTGRTTAPQSSFTFAQVRIGIVVLLLGLLITFGIPTLVL